MKFNTTYIPATSLKETVEEIALVREEILSFLTKRFNLLNVYSPTILDKSDERLIDIMPISRSINFDLGDESKIAQLVTSPTNWLRDLINRLNLKDGEGLITEFSTIFRDAIETPTTTVARNEIIVQLKIENLDDANDICKSIVLELYEKFYQIAKDIGIQKKIINSFPKKIEFVDAQYLENIDSNATPKEREINHSLTASAYFMKNPGIKLHSGHTHTKLPPQVYDLNNYYQLVVEDSINTSVLKPLMVSLLANGVQLQDQLKMYDLDSFRTKSFYQKLMKEKFKVIEIRINIPKLLMSIMKKGHISELQPGVISEESNIIELRHKVEKI